MLHCACVLLKNALNFALRFIPTCRIVLKGDLIMVRRFVPAKTEGGVAYLEAVGDASEAQQAEDFETMNMFASFTSVDARSGRAKRREPQQPPQPPEE
jgi:hypothetical protein